MYRIDIGFDEQRGYAAVIADPLERRMKGIKGNSIEQIMSRLRRVIIDEEGKKKHFPLEKEEPSRIITDGF
jgi:hypothetical protein